jgi:hypothetical protein
MSSFERRGFAMAYDISWPARRLAVVLGLVVVLTLALQHPAQAAFGVANFDGQVTDASGNPFTQAGGHPFALSTEIDYNAHLQLIPPTPLSALYPDEPTKDITVNTPPGLAGDPTAVAKCTLGELAYDRNAPSNPQGPLCPVASQIGTAVVTVDGLGTPTHDFPPLPVYNMVPPPNVPARFGFNVVNTGVIVLLDASVRSGSDYGISVKVNDVSEGLAILGTKLTLWGVPGDPAHDPDRACPGLDVPGTGGPPASDPSCPTQVTGGALPQAPFLRMPTSCPSDPSTTGLPWSMETDSWLHPGAIQTASFVSHVAPGLPDDPNFPGLLPAGWGHPQGMTGCADVPFDPTFTAAPATPASPGASGYTFDLSLPQPNDPSLIGESDLRSATVTLPAGVRVSPSAAHGLQGCSPAQIALASAADPTCPDGSKVGTVRIVTPLLDQPLDGSVYLATPHDNPTKSLLAIYLVAKGPGVTLKLPGSVSADPVTGQLKTTFDNQPQLPFSNLHLEFFGGNRASLTNPPTCGTYTTHAVMVGWSGKTVTSDSSFTTSHDGHGAPCPGPQFAPSFSAGTTNPIAGRHSPLTVTVARSDDDQEIASIDSIGMPDGLLAKIASVPLCANAQSRAGTCGAASQIGTVTTAAGPGPDPFAVSGRVYLAGRYKTAPFSLSVVVPVVAGPFDLGTVVIRSAVFVDRHNATLRVATDPLPTILQGIPLQVRLVNVTIDRPGFVLNPTSCATKQITSTIRSTGGLVSHPSERFQAAECQSLGFAPKMVLSVGGRGHTAHGASTPLTTTLTMPKGQANLKSVSVALPETLNARLDIVNRACTQAQFDAGHCEQARAGTAVAVTPLLSHALRGGVYFVKTAKKGALPNLVVALRGQVDFDLVGKITIPGGTKLATRFGTIPDVPVSKFVLRLVSGRNGPVGDAANLCAKRSRQATAGVTFIGQNGKVVSVRQALRIGGCAKR